MKALTKLDRVLLAVAILCSPTAILIYIALTKACK